MITGGLVSGSFHAGLGENIDRWLSGQNPDIIFLMIGSNDLALGYDVHNAPARMAALLDQISALAPRAKIVVSTVLYSRIEAANSAISEFNQALFPITLARKRVYLLDLSYILTIPADYDDDYHPNLGGYDKLGHAIALSLKPFEQVEILKRK
jgi:lysophospholipase L1-like esterase